VTDRVKPEFVVSSVDFDQPVKFSARKLLAHLRNPANWREASIHPLQTQYPFTNIEFHDRAGFSILLFPSPRAIGTLAASRPRLSEPSVLVCLGGQVIERWPRELFLVPRAAEEVIAEFLIGGKQSKVCWWVRLDQFKRETVHPGGKGLIRLWQRLQSHPNFPFAR
jgi:hypothetical protein